MDVSIEDLVPANYTLSTFITIGPFIADGQSRGVIYIYVLNNGKPVADFIPTYSVSGSGNSLGACSPTTPKGLSICYFGSSEHGPKTVSLTRPLSKEQNMVLFVPYIKPTPGFSISNGGGLLNGAISGQTSIGLITAPINVATPADPAAIRLRQGLQGVLFNGVL